ncbi:MAG: hypothetical protein IJE12_02250 [Prevotella sp.]|nr:hypothetical protein [Prevotella sp.]
MGISLSLIPRIEALASPYLSERATPKPTPICINLQGLHNSHKKTIGNHDVEYNISHERHCCFVS